jgi:hypothetical protein
VLERLRPESTLVDTITSTFGLLLPEDDKGTMAKLINTLDSKGATPLHYAVSAHARCGGQGSDHAYHTIQWLCSRGADASIVDCSGQSVLHRLAYWSRDGDPLDLRSHISDWPPRRRNTTSPPRADARALETFTDNE